MKKGNFLISYPFLEDDFFFRSLVYMLEFNKEELFGLILNKKMPYKVDEVLPGFPLHDVNLYMGGPVDTQRIFFIHKCKELKDSLPIGDGFYWNGDINELFEMLELEYINRNEIRFYLGYSGWGYDQLHSEIAEKSWLISEKCHNLIFSEEDDDKIWRQSIETLGAEYSDIAHYPIDPQLN